MDLILNTYRKAVTEQMKCKQCSGTGYQAHRIPEIEGKVMRKCSNCNTTQQEKPWAKFFKQYNNK